MKKKLLTTFIGLMMCLAVIAVGVYAVSYLKLEVSGEIDFISYDTIVYIEKVEIKNFVETTDGGETYNKVSKTLEDFNGKYLRGSNSVSTIDISTLNVMAGEHLLIEISLIGFSSDDIQITATNNSVSGVSVAYLGTTIPANAGGTIESGKSSVFTIQISNTGTGNLNLSNLNIQVAFDVYKEHIVEANASGVVQNQTNTALSAVSYTLNEAALTASVGSVASGTTEVVIADKITVGTKSYTVTEIPDAQEWNGSPFYAAKDTLVSVTLPKTITKIGDYAFELCTKIESLCIPESVREIGICAFSDMTGLTTITIKGGVTTIESCALANTTSLKSVVFPTTITSLPEYLFTGSNVETVVIPNSITTIGNQLFNCCSKLKTIVIPASVKTINGGIGSEMNALQSITFEGVTPPTITDYVGWPTNVPYYVPNATALTAYTNAYSSYGWNFQVK